MRHEHLAVVYPNPILTTQVLKLQDLVLLGKSDNTLLGFQMYMYQGFELEMEAVQSVVWGRRRGVWGHAPKEF